MSILNNGLSGISASRQMLDATSQNIANMNTKGYTRQDGILVSRAGSGGALSPGNGVELSKLIRITDDYLETSLWTSSSADGYDTQYRKLLGQVESIVGSPGSSIAIGIDQIFESMSQAAESPESNTARQQVINEASSLAGRFNQMFSNLSIQERQINEQSEAMVKSINAMAGDVAALNRRILDLTARGGNPGQLEDQRNLAIQDISQSLEVRVQRMDNGSVTLTAKSGQPIVLGSEAAKLSLTGTVLKSTLNGVDFELNAPGGQLGALQNYKTGYLADIKQSLNDQAVKLADDINAQLGDGFDKNLDPGAPLFTYNAAAPGETLKTTDISPEELAFIGGDGAGNPVGGIGDNANLLNVIEMRPTFYDQFTDLIGKIGIESRQAQLAAESSSTFLAEAQQRRDAVSAVNQDEEAVNIMKFNQAYQANAKVIGTASDLFDTIMRMF